MGVFSYELLGTDLRTTPGAEDGEPGEIAEVTDLCDTSLARLMHQYHDSLRLRALVCAFLAPAQIAEANVYDLLTEVLDVDTAVGAQLDIIGAIVGEPRAGFADAAYRRALRVRILVNRSEGKAEQLIAIVQKWIGSASPTEIADFYPAGMHVETLDYADDPVRLFARLMEAKAAGVLLNYIYSADDATTFSLSGTHDTNETSATTGLGSAHTSTGGTLAGVLG